METQKKASKDESFKRPGSIPFKWEIQPGIPKPHKRTTNAQKQLPKLSPPPSYIGKQGPLPLRHQAPPVSQGCFPVQVQSIKHREREVCSKSSPQRSVSARYSSPFSFSFNKSRAKEEIGIVAQWLFQSLNLVSNKYVLYSVDNEVK